MTKPPPTKNASRNTGKRAASGCGRAVSGGVARRASGTTGNATHGAVARFVGPALTCCLSCAISFSPQCMPATNVGLC